MSMLFKRIKDWAVSITSFRTGDVIPVDGPDGTAKMSKDDLLELTAQNALSGNLAPAFDQTRTENDKYVANEQVVYDGNLYEFTVDHWGAWNPAHAIRVLTTDANRRLRDNKIASSNYYDGYVSISGTSVQVYTSISNAHFMQVAVPAGVTKLCIRAKRVSSTYKIVGIFVGSNNVTSLGIVQSTSDEYADNVVDVPTGATALYVNCMADTNASITYDAVNLVEPLKVIAQLNPKLLSGYAVTSGGQITVLDNVPNSKYAVIDTWHLRQASLVNITTEVSSTYKTIVVFELANGSTIAINAINYGISSTFINIPEDAIRAYINCVGTSENIQCSFISPNPSAYSIAQNPLSKCIISNDDTLTALQGISRIDIYGDLHKCYLKSLSYDPSTYTLQMEILDKGPSTTTHTFTHVFDTAPAKNGACVSFIAGSANFIYAEVDIDFSLIDSLSFSRQDTSVSLVISPLDKLQFLRGDIQFRYDGYCMVPEGTALIGQQCRISVFSDNSGFGLRSNTRISGITFEDKSISPLVRTEYSAAEIAENDLLRYLFMPEITATDLANVNTDELIGDGALWLLYIRDDSQNVCVENCTFNHINRGVIYDGGDRHTASTHSCISNNMFDSCRCALYVHEEFTRISCNYFYGCVVGIYKMAHNFNAVNCMFVRCDCGLYFANETAHGEISTFEFAHNGIAGVYIVSMPSSDGFIFTNCQFAQADIIAEQARALKLTSCRIDSFIGIQSGLKNSIIGCNVRDVYAIGAGHSSWITAPSDTLVTLNRAIENEADSKYNWS